MYRFSLLMIWVWLHFDPSWSTQSETSFKTKPLIQMVSIFLSKQKEWDLIQPIHGHFKGVTICHRKSNPLAMQLNSEYECIFLYCSHLTNRKDVQFIVVTSNLTLLIFSFQSNQHRIRRRPWFHIWRTTGYAIVVTDMGGTCCTERRGRKCNKMGRSEQYLIQFTIWNNTV